MLTQGTENQYGVNLQLLFLTCRKQTPCSDFFQGVGCSLAKIYAMQERAGQFCVYRAHLDISQQHLVCFKMALMQDSSPYCIPTGTETCRLTDYKEISMKYITLKNILRKKLLVMNVSITNYLILLWLQVPFSQLCAQCASLEPFQADLVPSSNSYAYRVSLCWRYWTRGGEPKQIGRSGRKGVSNGLREKL